MGQIFHMLVEVHKAIFKKNSVHKISLASFMTPTTISEFVSTRKLVRKHAFNTDSSAVPPHKCCNVMKAYFSVFNHKSASTSLVYHPETF